MASCTIVLEYIEGEKRHGKLQLNEFMLVTSILMQDRNALVLNDCKTELLERPLSEWLEVIEKTASTIHLSDRESIQEAINEFVCAYGPISMPFSETLFGLESPLGLIIHETKNKPNNKQLALA